MYIILKVFSRGFHELESFVKVPLDVLRLDMIVEDKGYVRHDFKGIDI